MFAIPLELSRRLHPSETGGDQQIPLERAFAAPFELTQRLGRSLDAEELADYDPDALGAVFSRQPAPHRFPGSMAKRVQALCRIVVDTYGGDADGVWTTAADGRQLLRQVAALPGFGTQKFKIFVALLGKQLGVHPPGWREACAPFGDEGSYRSVADITSPESRTKVRDFKKAMKAAANAGVIVNSSALVALVRAEADAYHYVSALRTSISTVGYVEAAVVVDSARDPRVRPALADQTGKPPPS